MASRSPKAARSPKGAVGGSAASCVDENTTFVQADPATFRALVQKLTGAPGSGSAPSAAEKQQQQQEQAVTVALLAPPRRPKLQERRRAAPARLELARPQSFYYYYHHHGGFVHSPVLPMDAYVLVSSSSPSLSSSSSMSPSPHSSSSRGVVLSKEEEREEKAIASKAFYLHSSPRSAGDGERPKLLPLFLVQSPRSSFASS